MLLFTETRVKSDEPGGRAASTSTMVDMGGLVALLVNLVAGYVEEEEEASVDTTLLRPGGCMASFTPSPSPSFNFKETTPRGCGRYHTPTK